MKRRELLTAGASIVSVLPFARVRAGAQQQERERPLTDILPPDTVIPEEFEPLGSPERHWTLRTSTPYETKGADASFALQKYGTDSDKRLTKQRGRIETQARLARDDERTSDCLDAHHQLMLEEGFHGQEPSEERFTGWCETKLTEQTVGGCRRSEFWLRSPEIHKWPGQEQSTGVSKPHREYALIVQSTGWGPLSVEVERIGVEKRRELHCLATRLMKHMQLAAAMGPPPTRGAQWCNQ